MWWIILAIALALYLGSLAATRHAKWPPRPPHTPFTPAKAGVQHLGFRLRGNERGEDARP
jgi:hypothetical protein